MQRSALLQAYAAAEYAVFAEPRFSLRIGEPSAQLDALLRSEGVQVAAFITACNPRSERRSDAGNHAAMVALEATVLAHGHRFLAGEGRDPGGRWPAEPSLLVLGMERGEAQALGRSFDQAAIVCARLGHAPELVVVDEGARMRVVLDTNVWLDWLVFRDPSVEPLKRAHAEGRLAIVCDAACAAELERVLGYDMGRWTLSGEARERALEAFRLACAFFEDPGSEMPPLPVCSDVDDQKFLMLAAASRAQALVTKDHALLALPPRSVPFRIATPSQLL